jgi:hypothetical protein
VCSFVLLFVRVVDIVNDCCYRQRNYSKKKIHKHIEIHPSSKNTRSIKSNVTYHNHLHFLLEKKKQVVLNLIESMKSSKVIMDRMTNITFFFFARISSLAKGIYISVLKNMMINDYTNDNLSAWYTRTRVRK